MNNKIAIVQTSVPEYRQLLFKELKNNYKDCNFTIFSDYISFNNVKYIIKNKDFSFLKIKNIFFFNFLLFQFFNYFKLKSYDIVVIDNNSRNISNYIIYLFSKIFKKKIFIWGHNPKKTFTLRLKLFLINNSDGFISYTDYDKKIMQNYVSKKTNVISINNSCISKRICSYKKIGSDLIFIGRLDEDKNPIFLINLFYHLTLLNNFNKFIKLHLIGNGNLYHDVKNLIEKLKLNKRIIMYGKITNNYQLKDIFMKSIITINPGTIGLSAMHSFAFGNFIISNKFLEHGPEISICNSTNSFLFENYNINQWANFILNKMNTLSLNEHKRISDIISNKYNIENMAFNFYSLLK